MRILIPPGQSRASVSASMLISRTEATELRDALDLVLTSGRSDWMVSVAWGEDTSQVTLALELGDPRSTLDRP